MTDTAAPGAGAVAVRRIGLPSDDGEFMPARGKALAQGEIEVIRAWVLQGANWPDPWEPDRHWSYVKPGRPALPGVGDSAWPRNEIDRFVLARLERGEAVPALTAVQRRIVEDFATRR